MKVDVLLGLQWGDEGKGKVVDVLTPKYDVVARFQGGPNAGHTLEFEGQKYVLRSIPSGIFQGDKVNIIGNGVVLDPALFKAEAEALEASGHNLKERLPISKKAQHILPTPRILDATIFLANKDDFAAMNKAWDAWVVAGHAPVRCTVQATLMKPEYKVEIKIIAAV